MAKYCHECGKPVQLEWNLCPICGANLKTTETSETQKQSTIIFKSKGYFCVGKPKGFTLSGNMKKGFIILSNWDLTFLIKRSGKFIIPIVEIEKVVKFTRRMYVFIEITSKAGKSYTIWSANMVLGSYLGGKTNELYSLLSHLIN
ncbi:hypothetical protein LCGC14_1316040 [marine sediment metagenome]|uniref:Zinc-ribbon domain-containing protein n=1 Tax=marine sediment metagenome TaxID=412755 RepID=A0A0F9L689_9ZZZZ|nr:zinc ribbon domain-containing protein [bacterium]